LIDLFGVGNDPLKERQLDDLLFRLESEDATVDHLAGFPLASFSITVSENPEKPDSTSLM
jgi:hypothetical protein